ncbi:outer membrane protein assembly factor BamB family protein [Rhodococcoides yunnanense]|uniref:outer membrane protein assembly factor BamB family protein n=1 Tax=Rhodococcoides yunnanense TaxID=278209 RepID=UPI0009328180|nr:PQQ-binding-like beta-propeller repeat protein [Rhodococcus yunnanensis]
MKTQLVIAGVVAVVTVSAAAVVLAQDRTTTIKRITDASPGAPGLAWATEASASGLDGATFSDPRTGSIYPWGVGVIRVEDVLLTLAVVPDGDGPNSDAVMLGIDSDTGEVKWTSPAGDFDACSEQTLDGNLVCSVPSYGENPGLVTFDVETGQSRHFDTAPYMFAATVANERLYVAEGDLEDADVQLHRGTLDDYDADWSTSLPVSAGWEDQYADQLKVGSDVGYFDLGGDFATFHAQSGAEIWTTDILDDCLISQYRTAGDLAVGSTFDCDASSSDVTGTIAFTRDGDVLATSSSPAQHYLSIDEPTDVTVPIVLGDKAFDRTTGDELWRSGLLVLDQEADEWNEARTRGTLVAVVGDIGLLQLDERTVAIDLRSGEQRWQADEVWSTIARDGDAVLTTSGGSLIAVDVRTGEKLWSAEYSKMLPEESSSVDTYVGGGDGTFLLQSGSTLAQLAPLPN